MKKSLVGMLALLAGAYAVHAQGTVSMGNYLVLTPYVTASYNGTPLGGSATGGQLGLTKAAYGNAATIANGNDWTVQLYGAPGTVTTGLVPLTGATATFADGIADGVAGTWNSVAVGVITGAAGNGSPASVQLAYWYNDGGTITSLAMAQADGVPTGLSAILSTVTGGPPEGSFSQPASPSPLPAFGNTALTAVPEPSTIALGVIGASAFLMRLRRKN